MHKTNQSHSNHANSKRPRVEFNSKHIKGKKKHMRMKSELVGGTKKNLRDQSQNFDVGDSSPFGKNINNQRRGGRRNNLSIENTFDFFGFKSSNPQNNVLNASNTDLSGLFRTMNAEQRQKNNNFTSAAEAMGGDNGRAPQRSSFIFSRPFGFANSFHNRHNSVNLENKKNNSYFETEVDHRLDSLENNKLPK